MDITPTDRKSKIVWNMKIYLQKKKKKNIETIEIHF